MTEKQRRLQAQVNGAKAAGTKSPAGLQISSENAVRHGLTSKPLVLSNESQAVFEQLRDSYIAKFQPQDDVEMDLVHEMVAALWRLRRMRGIETALFDLEMDRQEEEIEKDFSHIDEPTRTAVAYTSLANNSNTLSLYLRYETTFRRSFDRALSNLLRLRALNTQTAETAAPPAPQPVPIAIVGVQKPASSDAQIHPDPPTESTETENYETTPKPSKPPNPNPPIQTPGLQYNRLPMQLTTLDWIVVALYFAFNIGIGFYYKARAGSGVSEFFLAGRNVPWWLAGTSMVATTFAADTPLAVTGMVAKGGIAGNWLWWNFVASGMLTVFFYARPWRRSGVMTDIEFSEIRYAGKPAAFLRGFRALYLGIPINCIVLGWVNLAMVKILMLILGVTKFQALLVVMGLIAFTSIISTLSGLWGVLVTDVFQFVIKMTMVVVLAVVAVQAVGGIDAMKTKLAAIDVARGSQTGGKGSVLSFLPDVGSAWMPMITFFVYISVNWWATWYPGAEPGGGGYVAQRMFSAKNEKHSLLATLWFNIAHYAIRPWPWVLVALASLILYPNLADPETGYIRVMIDHLPPSLRGLMVAAFAAAYMSTIATQLNWGASYLVNDFYRRFLNKTANDRHYVRASQLATILITVVSAVLTFYMESISGAWKLLIVTGAGTGGVLLLRWYWWRINAWSEVSSMISAFIVSVSLQTVWGLDSDNPTEFAYIMLITVAITTVVWVAVTFLTAPESQETLVAFYRRTAPSLTGWRPIAALAPEVKPRRDGLSNLLDWVCGCILIYGVLFGVGKLILKETGIGIVLLACGLLAGAVIYWDLSRRGWSSVVD